MLWTTPFLLLAPLAALGRPHSADSLVQRRQHQHQQRAAAAAAAAATGGPLVERAGAAIGNDTRDAISAWRHSNEVAQHQTSSAVDAPASASGIAGVGTALSAVNTPSASATPTAAEQSSAPEQGAESQAESQAQPSVVETVTSQETQPEPSSAEAVAASPSPSTPTESSADPASSSASTRSSVTHTTVVTASRSSTVVRVTASSSASATAASSNDEPEKIAGINKTTFIIIIVVAAVVALVAVGWTVFRKWKLRPSRRFDEKMRPIDFSPDNGDVFAASTEKSHGYPRHLRSSSNSSAAMHRQELVDQLDDPKHVAGIPDHDFTAGGNMAGHGAYDMYNQDPYAHAEAYEYDAAYSHHHYDHDQRGAGAYHDEPTQDTGYADLQRGNSVGSGSGHGHGQQYPVESFPVPDHYLNRSAGDAVPYGTSSRF